MERDLLLRVCGFIGAIAQESRYICRDRLRLAVLAP